MNESTIEQTTKRATILWNFTIEEARKELAEHTRRHFETTERLIAAHAYPDRYYHAHIVHVHLLEDLAKLRLDYIADVYSSEGTDFIARNPKGPFQPDDENASYTQEEAEELARLSREAEPYRR